MGFHCETYLDAILGKIRLEREHFASVHVRVVCFLKGLFQLVQLVTGEYRAAEGGEVDQNPIRPRIEVSLQRGDLPVPPLLLLLLAASEAVDAVDRKLLADIHTWE